MASEKRAMEVGMCGACWSSGRRWGSRCRAVAGGKEKRVWVRVVRQSVDEWETKARVRASSETATARTAESQM